MSVASMRYGTIRRPTAFTTDTLEGFIRHETSARSSERIVLADIGGLLPVEGFAEAPPGFGATRPRILPVGRPRHVRRVDGHSTMPAGWPIP